MLRTVSSAARDQLASLPARAGDWTGDWRFPNGVVPRSAAVLVLFGVLDRRPAEARSDAVGRDLDVLLQRRAATLGSHPSQVSFPGGRVDEGDADATATALREAEEETGLDPTGVDVLGQLPELPVPRSRHLVVPVLGWWRRPSEVAAVDQRETQEVFRLPVADLLDPENRRTVQLEFEGRTLRSPAFELGGVQVWGFTARVLDGLFDELGWTEPWDRDRLVDPIA